MATGIIQIPQTPQIIPITGVKVTPTTANHTPVNSIYAYQYGKFIELNIVFNGGSSTVNVGSDAFYGNVSGIPLPLFQMHTLAFLGSSSLVAYLDESGLLRIRVQAANKGNVSQAIFVEHFFYFTN